MSSNTPRTTISTLIGVIKDAAVAIERSGEPSSARRLEVALKYIQGLNGSPPRHIDASRAEMINAIHESQRMLRDQGKSRSAERLDAVIEYIAATKSG